MAGMLSEDEGARSEPLLFFTEGVPTSTSGMASEGSGLKPVLFFTDGMLNSTDGLPRG